MYVIKLIVEVKKKAIEFYPWYISDIAVPKKKKK